MNTMRITAALLLSFLTASMMAQVPGEVQQLATTYQQLLQDRSFQQAASYLYTDLSYVMSIEDWVRAQESTINEDMTMKTVELNQQNQTISVQNVDAVYYLFSVPERLEVNMERAIEEGSEAMAEIMESFKQSYRGAKTRSIGTSQFVVDRIHQFMVVPGKGEETPWAIIDFPNGKLDLAYGILPAGVWEAFYPEEALTEVMPYQQAVRQSIGHYFQLLKAKKYDTAAQQTVNPSARFMSWNKSLDHEYTELSFDDYRITTLIRRTERTGKQYAGAVMEWKLKLKIVDEDLSEEDRSTMDQRLAEVYPNGKLSFDEQSQTFLITAYRSVIAVADAKQNNWKLLFEDEANGMSLKQETSAEIRRAIGME